MATKKQMTIDEKIAIAEAKAKEAKRKANELKKQKEKKDFEVQMKVVKKYFSDMPSDEKELEKYFENLIAWAEFGQKKNAEDKAKKQAEIKAAQERAGQSRQ